MIHAYLQNYGRFSKLLVILWRVHLNMGIFSFIYLMTTYISDEKGSIYFTFAEYTVINEGATFGRKCGAIVVKEAAFLERAIWRKKNGKPSSREKVAT